MKSKRPRIKTYIDTNLTIQSNYGEYFQTNAASKNAKFLKNLDERLTIELWIDKHYLNRINFGDEFGERKDIEIIYIEELIQKSIKHLIYYTLKHSRFIFINFPPPKARNIRIVLKEQSIDTETLNVVVEYHFLDFNNFEVTVITAMRNENFVVSDGQCIITFENDISTLYIFKNKKEEMIDTFPK